MPPRPPPTTGVSAKEASVCRAGATEICCPGAAHVVWGCRKNGNSERVGGGDSTPQEEADLLDQVLLGERFGKERSPVFEEPALEDLGGKAGHVENRLPRPALLHVAA